MEGINHGLHPTGGRIFACIATDVKNQLRVGDLHVGGALTRFWTNNLIPFDDRRAPSGSYSASSVKLIHEIKLNERI